jgi:pyrroloquinoline quinone biosynthesis protein B
VVDGADDRTPAAIGPGDQLRIRILGSAAGGGFPQWNCDCPCCQAVRDGSRPARPRTQSSAAVSADGDRWVLLNASPDIRQQIESVSALRARNRVSPVTDVLLTDAELDHTLGLLLLREATGVRIHGTEPSRAVLRDGTALLPTLGAYCPVDWNTVTLGTGIPLPGGLTGRAFDVPTTKRQRFDVAGADGPGRVVGYRITATESGASLVWLPCAQELGAEILSEIRGCDCLLIDGTCWTDDEMITLGLAGKTSRSMGHVPVSGGDGSLAALSEVPVPRKVYVHLNNTNPVLLEDSPERKETEAGGFEVAYDGMEIDIPNREREGAEKHQ